MQTEKKTNKKRLIEAFDILDDALYYSPPDENDISEHTKDFLRNIELSNEQQKVAKMNSTHLLIKGTAGSGKSITLLSRMMQKMTEEYGKKFLFVSFNKELVRDSKRRFKQSKYYEVVSEHNHCVHFYTFHELAHKLLASIGVEVPSFNTSHANLTRSESNDRARMKRLMELLDTEEFKELPSIYTIKKTNNYGFLRDEFLWMKGNGFITKDDYLNCERVGRGRLPNVSIKQRKTIFRLFEYYLEDQQVDFYNRMDREDYAIKVMENLHRILDDDKYHHIFIDEVQDLQPMQLRVLVAMHKSTLSLGGDERQRIYKSSPFSFKALGINVQSGNNVILKRNWRSTYQIMKLANSLKFKRTAEDSKYDDEKYFPRTGPKPLIQAFKSIKNMLNEVGEKINSLRETDSEATFAIIHRRNKPQEIGQIKTYLGRYFTIRTNMHHTEKNTGRPNIYFIEAKTTKGLEFDYVFILDFNIHYYPHKDELANISKSRLTKTNSQGFNEDKIALEEKEKRVLYVSLTRTKKECFLYYAYKNDSESAISPFAADFNTEDYRSKGFRKTFISSD